MPAGFLDDPHQVVDARALLFHIRQRQRTCRCDEEIGIGYFQKAQGDLLRLIVRHEDRMQTIERTGCV